jgi:hypothetical protein
MDKDKQHSFELELRVEICCEECMEPIQFHLSECPVCKTKDAPTDCNSPEDCIRYENGIFKCGECGSKFLLLRYDYDNKARLHASIELLEEKVYEKPPKVNIVSNWKTEPRKSFFETEEQFELRLSILQQNPQS